MQGNVCIAGITKEGAIYPKFADNVGDAIKLVDGFIAENINVYFTPGAYEGHRRNADSCISVRSFFLDLDVAHGKNVYASSEEALADVERFRNEISWPKPVLVDSGGGIHAYWMLKQPLLGDEWRGYAKQFKQLCLDHSMIIDEGVPADAARLMRVPGTSNYRYDPPKPSTLLTDIYSYDFADLVPALGDVEIPLDLSKVDKGLDDDTKAILDARRGNFEYDFSKIVIQSLEGAGCGQIKHIIENAATCPEPLWYAGLSVAVRCRDGSSAVHQMSEDYPGYSVDNTERKAAQSLKQAEWSHGCSAFEKENKTGCDGCPHRGKISGPIKLGQVLKTAEQPPEQTDEAQSVRDEETPQKITVFPDFLFPYSRGVNGGVYYTPPPRSTKKGMVQDPEEVITPNDLYPTKRVYSPHDGECLLMLLALPRDDAREFLLPLKDVTALDKLKSILASNGVVFEPAGAGRLASYLMKWTDYLINKQKADIMRIQQGWTEERKSFVLGTNEYSEKGVEYCPPSPMSKNIVKHLKPAGSFDIWRECSYMFNDPGYEFHAFTMLCGFATPLMELTNVNGVTLSLFGESGAGKTGALYGAMSIWGKPDSLAVNDATPNALTQRQITSKNITFGLDEQTNLDGKVASSVIYNVSSGTPKIRMMASTNQERNVEYITKLIAIITTNRPIREIMSEFKMNTSAEEMRILEPYMHVPGVTGFELTQNRGKLMFDRLKENYGHAGPIYIKRLFEIGLSELRRQADIEFINVGSKYSARSEYRFLSNLLSVVRVAGSISNELHLTNYDLDRILNVVGVELLNIISGKRRDDANGRDDVLGDFINKNIQNCLVIREGKVTTEPRNALYIRAEVDEGLIWISSSALKSYLHDIRLSAREFESRLTAKGILKSKMRKQMAAGWKEALGAVNVNAYEIEMDVSKLFHVETEKPTE